MFFAFVSHGRRCLINKGTGPIRALTEDPSVEGQTIIHLSQGEVVAIKLEFDQLASALLTATQTDAGRPTHRDPIACIGDLIHHLGSEARELAEECVAVKTDPEGERGVTEILVELIDVLGYLDPAIARRSLKPRDIEWLALTLSNAASAHALKCAQRGLKPLETTYQLVQTLADALRYAARTQGPTAPANVFTG